MKVIDLYEGNPWESGGDGYIIKAGQGQLEYQWRLHAARADLEGKPWGLYWVSDSRYSPESHKAAIKSAFPGGYFGALGLWIDIEKPYIGMTDAAYRQTPYAYYKPVESLWRGVFQHTGIYPGMYFGPGTWDLIMSGAPQVLQQEFADKCDCWIAHYTLAQQPDMRGKWVSWAMWQYQGEPDYNQVNPDWWERVTGNPPPPPPPPTGGMMYEATVKVYKLNVRSDHVADATDVGDLLLGVKVQGDLLYTAPNGEVWLRIPWQGGVAWIATKFGGQDLCTVVNLGGTPPPTSTTKTIELVDDGVVWKGTLTRQ
jgi:hypothetical protein